MLTALLNYEKRKNFWIKVKYHSFFIELKIWLGFDHRSAIKLFELKIENAFKIHHKKLKANWS